MRPTTPSWMLCDSIGYPKLKLKTCGTIAELIRAQAEWLLQVPMGSKIVITLARTEAELDPRLTSTNAMMSQIFDGLNLAEEDQDEPE